MSLLNKFELNKLIVSMRHNVNRAKVQTLNKLSRLSKTLKSKKATENLRLKNEKKAERLVNEILVMKKIPTDEIAAFSLSNTKQVNDILSDVESSFRLRALARLSTHKSISPIVQQFRAKYPSWEEEFHKVLLALKKREKLKPGASKGSENNPNVQKTTKIDNIKTGAAGFQSEDEDSDENSSGKTEDDSSGCDITEIENNRNVSPENVVICTRGNRFSVSSDDVSVSEISPKRSVIEDKFSVQTLRPVKKKIQIDNSILKQTAFEGNNKGSPLKKQETTKSEKLVKRNSPNELPIQKTKKKIDPFFLECDDRPYETFDTENPKSNVKQLNSYNDDIDVSDSEHSDNSEQSFVGEEGAKKFRSNNKISFTTNNKLKKNVLHNKTNVKQSGKIGLNNKSKLNKRKAGPKVAPKEINEKLHPSWEAKKKMSVMANYQGKKIVFD